MRSRVYSIVSSEFKNNLRNSRSYLRTSVVLIMSMNCRIRQMLLTYEHVQ